MRNNIVCYFYTIYKVYIVPVSLQAISQINYSAEAKQGLKLVFQKYPDTLVTMRTTEPASLQTISQINFSAEGRK